MITIKENIPKKMPGMTSLFIESPYNPKIVETIREVCDVCYFDKKTKIWEVPTTCLAVLVDELCQFDDIEIYNYKEKEPVYEKITIDMRGLKSKPFEHQLDGIEYGLQHDKWLLLDAPGLGKTLQIIGIANQLKREGKIKHCLIVCGINTLKYNWKAEIEKHSNLSATILGERITKNGKSVIGSVADRVNHLKKSIKEFFVITNIETLRSKEIIKTLKDKKLPNKFDMIVLDESHVIKSSSSTQASNFLKLDFAKYRICATGTLLLNNVVDCHVPMVWIGQEHSNRSTFEHYYLQFGGYFNHEVVGVKNTDVLKEHLSRCSLRRTKDLLHLPEKTIITEYVDMQPRQEEFYQNIVNGIVKEVDKVQISNKSLLGLFARLRQASELPSILTTEDIPSSKIDRAVDLVNQLVSNGEQVVVFSSFKQPIYEMAGRLKDLKVSINTGDQLDEEISSNMKVFQEKKSSVFLGTWQKCGTGITLNSASYMIFLSTPFTAGAFEQACDRIHRIGTKKPAFIYNLVCKDTIDERVAKIITDKKYLSDYIIDDEISQSAMDYLKEYILEFSQNVVAFSD